ncbi:MAG TPA: hypothetical protein VMD07_08510 [Candidatus Acidoferrales bacterium]|nr:hypothetical protein [Candidatus Acidoferrales bacterium]
MARRLETLEVGTPVFCGEKRVGTVDGVYAEGTAEVAEYMVVRWESRDNTPVLIATKDVETLEGRGVTLIGDDPQQYTTAPKYEDKLYPSLRRIH